MPRGGARANAGRKPKAEKFETQINRAERVLADKLPWVFDKLMELGEGVTVEDTGKDGQPRIYTQPPDRVALIYMADRIMGKPTLRNEHTGPDGDPLRIFID